MLKKLRQISGEIEQMKYIYKKLDEMFDNGEFEKVDELIEFFIEDTWNFQIHMGFLAGCFICKDRLKNYGRLYNSATSAGLKELTISEVVDTLDGLKK